VKEADEDASLKDPRILLNIDVCVQRNLTSFIEFYRHIYEIDPIMWAKKQKGEELSLRKIYTEGWTKTLDAESRNKLSLIAKALEVTLEDFNHIDPYYIYCRLSDSDVASIMKMLAVEHLDTCHLQLDACIHDIFAILGKRVQGLENENDRIEVIYANLPACPYAFDVLKLILQNFLQKFPLSEKNFCALDPSDSKPQAPPTYTSTLDDLNFADPMIMSYLRGNFEPFKSEEVDTRNQKWLDQKN